MRFTPIAIVLGCLVTTAAFAQDTLPGWGAVPTGMASATTRAQVQAQTLQALHTGDTLAAGELGVTARALQPGAYAGGGMTAMGAAGAMDGMHHEAMQRGMAQAMPHGNMVAGGTAATLLY